ncbi:flagellar hook-basal body complex protein [Candidatus Enterococcus willemsii]|uniref:Flagellar hook protein FlgE n=1 Tax=Candidatus Enterococcus willemsii TaxID=1857215 RepID=A0ABQ6YWF6_9ENTE|nr:flagellar hook-basal body complex protein [Enterococcus sp. CU12B]KAF1302013.1 flagellar basal body rod protein FlgG [Enterococcus sp. CU12B]
MLRSLYSGVSGMKNLQTKMDVVSNNIANVNTVGFKSSRVMFQDMMNQTTASAARPANGLGGTNPRQVGLGVQVGSIDTVHTPGSKQSTGRDLDFYLTGAGYFVVRDGAGDELYTRDGIFTRDAEGSIVNSAGMKILGQQLGTPMTEDDYIAAVKGANGDPLKTFPTDPNNMQGLVVPATIDDANGTPQTYQSMAIDRNGIVTAKYGNTNYVLGKVAVATFTNPDGLEKQGGNNYAASPNTGAPIIAGAGENGSGLLESGSIEMSNVDLANEFTEMIVASRAYQANSRSITTSDEMLQELLNLKR